MFKLKINCVLCKYQHRFKANSFNFACDYLHEKGWTFSMFWRGYLCNECKGG